MIISGLTSTTAVPNAIELEGYHEYGVSARFVQNRTLTGVGRATQIKLHHGAYALAGPDFKQALEGPTPVLPQAGRLREPKDCSGLSINRLNAVLFAPSEQGLFHRTVFRIHTIVPACRAHAATP